MKLSECREAQTLEEKTNSRKLQKKSLANKKLKQCFLFFIHKFFLDLLKQ